MSIKTFKGKVVSNKMQKTVVVAVEVPKKHPIYGKNIRNTKRFKARDDIGLSIGDEVIIEECRPFSKNVSFRIVEKISTQEGKE
ncbi:MAG TPA: 30S ribosomal protein S17 [bacterium]|jgi:small subunit ribosomal protein S17|nr:30S ribosomal protein S17 [bacterium]HOV97590.1 30S ribosomal protein S17 [bacterium]HQG58293.1 30S ribosomal protein S17 [bacterium]HQG78737.1 30S ribosomal protein S17 [bacterium]HQK41397.1 30S ribosomal protein S17 [bacterium]